MTTTPAFAILDGTKGSNSKPVLSHFTRPSWPFFRSSSAARRMCNRNLYCSAFRAKFLTPITIFRQLRQKSRCWGKAGPALRKSRSASATLDVFSGAVKGPGVLYPVSQEPLFGVFTCPSGTQMGPLGCAMNPTAQRGSARACGVIQLCATACGTFAGG